MTVKMKSQLLTIVILEVITFLSVGLLFADYRQTTSSDPKRTKFILVKDAMSIRSRILKPNAAILITDNQLIKQDEGLFIGNSSYSHACGHNYEIQFWENTDKLIKSFPYNEECEEFRSNGKLVYERMMDYIKILETKPTHYIYNLKVPVSTSTTPDEAIKSVNNSNLTAFLFDGKTEHLPTITLSYMQVSKLKEMENRDKWEDEKNENRKLAFNKMTSIIQEIDKVAAIIEQSKIDFSMEGFGMEIENQVEVTLKFPIGTDLSLVKGVTTRNGAKSVHETVPEFYYIQLVDTASSLDDVKEKLKNSNLKNEIFEYPNTK